MKQRRKEKRLNRVNGGQTEETKGRNRQKDKREITPRHGLKPKKTEKGRDIRQSYRKTENKERETDIE